RFSRDWSSDVCSSDLRSVNPLPPFVSPISVCFSHWPRSRLVTSACARPGRRELRGIELVQFTRARSEAHERYWSLYQGASGSARSEERRVGKESRHRG